VVLEGQMVCLEVEVVLEGQVQGGTQSSIHSDFPNQYTHPIRPLRDNLVHLHCCYPQDLGEPVKSRKPREPMAYSAGFTKPTFTPSAALIRAISAAHNGAEALVLFFGTEIIVIGQIGSSLVGARRIYLLIANRHGHLLQILHM
jgi:hypothetical protein